MIDFEKLKRPFRPHEIEWRVGATNKDKTKGMALAYMDARAVMDRLDAVCGPENWQCRYPHAGSKTCCDLGIVINDTCVWKSDGAGDTDFEGDKGAFSDAFKRAAVRWGIGRYLYDIDAPWVPIEARGRSYAITEEGLTTLNKVYRAAIWFGPLQVTKLKEAAKKFAHDLNQCQSVDNVNLLVDANKEILEQMELDLPDWYFGKGDINGAQASISDKIEELSAKEAM